MWQRRHLILAYAAARNVSMYTEARLGQLWQVLTPLLNSCVYYLIFGIITLIRALAFPLACLPLTYVLVEFQQQLLVLVLFAIVLGTGEPAAYISLTRYAIMASIRADGPGAKPYNAVKCAVFTAKKIPALASLLPS